MLGTIPNGADELLQKNHGIPKAPMTVAAGIPKEALARRPDIYQAREEAVAQGAAVGATLATLYPAFSLAGNFAFTSNSIGTNSITIFFIGQIVQ